MRRIILSLLAALAVVATVDAQFPVNNSPYPLGPQYAAEVPMTETRPYVGPTWTINGEYLLWFLKPQNFAVPVLGTTTDPDLDLGNVVSPVGTNDPSFVNVLGPGYRNRGPYSGMRLSITRALPVSFDRCVYSELVGLWLPSQGDHRRLVSNPEGNPSILLPFNNNNPTPGLPAGQYSAVVAGNVGGARLSGNVDGYTATQLWGGEWNIAGPVYQSETFGLEALVGFRYLGLNDEFELRTSSNLAGGLSTFDRFATTNHFYGGQAGVRMIWSADRWAGMLATKVGLGDTNASQRVTGSATLPAGIPSGGLPGGFYTASSNLGSSGTDHFGVVVDLNASVRFAITQSLGISVGYNFLYWSGVLRATDQISGNVNPTYSAVLNSITGAALQSGPAEPERRKDVSDIWAHGLNFGIDLRF